MENRFEERLHDVDATVLMPLVRLALQDKDASLIDWQHEPMRGNAGLGVYGIARLGGRAQTDNGIVRWSIICKAIRGDGDGVSREPATWNYWKREVLAYQTDLLTDFPVGIQAPRCFGITKQVDEEYWIWLEDLGMSDSRQWSLEQFGVAARHLGQFNGAYLTGRPIPDLSWLSTARVEMWVQYATQNLHVLSDSCKDPEILRWLDVRRRERVLSLWQERERILNGLANLPRCLCHHDAFPRNLFLQRVHSRYAYTIVIDWAMVGPGRVGQEIASMLGGALSFMDVDIQEAQELERTVIANYIVGLQDAGWQGDANLARYGYSATLALLWGLGLCLFALVNIANKDRIADVERVTEHTYEQYLEQAFTLVDFALDHGEEALALQGSLAA